MLEIFGGKALEVYYLNPYSAGTECDQPLPPEY